MEASEYYISHRDSTALRPVRNGMRKGPGSTAKKSVCGLRFQKLLAKMIAPVVVRSGRRKRIPLGVGRRRMQRNRDRIFLELRFGRLKHRRSKFTLANSPVIEAALDRIRLRRGIGH